MHIGNKNGMKHGCHGTPLYKKWKSMRGRVASHPHYIEHGLECCEEWADFSVFMEWALENGYSEELTLDRIKTYEGYSPDNCRWVSCKVQAENVRKRKDNSSGYSGVHLEKSSGRFKVQIQVSGKKVYLGRYNTVEEGALAFNDYVLANGTDHRVNIIEGLTDENGRRNKSIDSEVR